MGYSNYAWIIVKDHLSEGPNDPMGNDKGTVGPRNAHISEERMSFSQVSAELANNYDHRHAFKMYDDDGELYYTGSLYWNGDAEPDEGILYGPLRDFGAPAAGCVLLKFPGKPGWEIG